MVVTEVISPTEWEVEESFNRIDDFFSDFFLHCSTVYLFISSSKSLADEHTCVDVGSASANRSLVGAIWEL